MYQSPKLNDLDVRFIQEDKMDPGSFIIRSGYSLIQYTPHQDHITLAGNKTQPGFANGPAHQSLLSEVFSVFQTGRRILIADTDAKCIRQLHRDMDNMTTLIGRCNEAPDRLANISVQAGGSVPAASNFFDMPTDVIYLFKQDMYLIYDTWKASIYKMEVSTQRISRLNPNSPAELSTYIVWCWLVDYEETTVYYFNHWGLSSINLVTYEMMRLIRDDKIMGVYTLSMGPELSEHSSFGHVQDLYWIVPDQIIAFKEATQAAVGTMNLAAQEINFHCSGILY